ncbi:leukemia-associated protein 7 [Stegostoma tigrinum]|uniref:leukemia-associated protein 7 n=1 Tax=Stegostoma tigrinum TaxID=3053191 RepID=UPI00202B5943|nr:leukemia-associated protein 7 [Stegostoma tigrinum]
MQSPVAPLQICIAHQQSALSILHQYLQDQRHHGPAQPSPSQNPRSSSPLRQAGSSCGTRRIPASATHSKRRTILQVARESKLTRLTGFISGLLDLEQNALSALLETHLHVECKLSAELRNLCSRMAAREDCLRLDADLKAIEECLRDIALQLLSSLSSNKSGSHLQTIPVLKELFKKFLVI